jgi:hypothetical protein
MDRQDIVKKMWTEPRLIVHGDVERLTQQVFKQFGPTDGFSFQGSPIGNGPS